MFIINYGYTAAVASGIIIIHLKIKRKREEISKYDYDSICVNAASTFGGV